VQEHEFFRREADDLFCHVAVNFPTLVLGGEISVPTLDGDDAIRVPEGTEAGTVFRLRGKGMPSVTGRGRGDLHVVLQPRTPKKLTKDQRAALETLAKVLPAEKLDPRRPDADADERGVFDRVKDLFS
jgi:molecular chaperone DnaJ